MGYTIKVTTDLPFAEAVEAVRTALVDNELTVVADMDVDCMFNNELGAPLPPYKILGVCRPELAYPAMLTDPRIGALLPFNVTIRVDGDATSVEAIDPSILIELSDDDPYAELAADAKRRIQSALAMVTEG